MTTTETQTESQAPFWDEIADAVQARIDGADSLLSNVDEAIRGTLTELATSIDTIYAHGIDHEKEAI